MHERLAKEEINKISNAFKVLLLTGPRQTGKTTLLKNQMPENMNYVTLDDEILRENAKKDPKMFLEEYKAPLMIDEAQYAPELFSYIKIIVDNNKYGQYWLTGSQRFSLMDNVSESLAGRVGIIELNSFTYNEIVNNKFSIPFDPVNMKKMPKIDVNDLYEYIFNGGMPELYSNENMQRDFFFNSYIKTYIERDVRKITNIGNALTFEKFMRDIASRNGEQLNYSKISDEIGMSIPTIKNWISILVKTGIIYLLDSYSTNNLKRATHMPKIIFMDSGLCSYLEGISSARELQLSDRAGHYLESYVISDIIKTYNAKASRLIISYYRDKDQNEIDLILEKNNTLYPFEIKKSANPSISMIKTFDKLKGDRKKIGSGGIICLYDTLMHLNKEHYIIPVSSVINATNEKEEKNA